MMKQITAKEISVVNGGSGVEPVTNKIFPSLHNNNTADTKCYGFDINGGNKVSQTGLDGVDCRVLCCQKTGMYDWLLIISDFAVVYGKC